MSGPLSTAPNGSVPAMLRERFGISEDMTPEAWEGLREGFLAFLREEQIEEGHAEDTEVVEDAGFNESDHPRAPNGQFGSGSGGSSGGGLKKPAAGGNVAEGYREEKDGIKTPQGTTLLKPKNKDAWIVKTKTGYQNISSAMAQHKIDEGEAELIWKPQAKEKKGGGSPGAKKKISLAEMRKDPTKFSEYRIAKIEQGDDPEFSSSDPASAGSEKTDPESEAKKSFPDVQSYDDYYNQVKFLSRSNDDEKLDLLKKAFPTWTKQTFWPKKPTGDSALTLALDRDSVREKRRDGQLHVKRAHITKANVCPYRGSEIPGWEDLGLEENKVYNLLRDPEELKKAAPSLNGVQLLRKHVPVNAEDHQPYDTVGSLGTDAEFVDDGGENYLDNSLFVNAADAIDGIESGKKRELSAGYHYTPDMTPGNFRGTRYDGVMRDIVFNHVALVEDGRAGPDVVVGDSMENLMAKPTKLGAHVLALTAARIAPLIAMDQKVTFSAQLVGLFTGLTTKNIGATKGKLLDGVRLALDGKTKPKLALDGPLEHLKAAVDAYEELAGPQANEPAPEETKVQDTVEPIEGEVEGKVFDAEAIPNFLRGKGMSEDDIKTVCDMMPKNGLAGDEEADEDDPTKKEGAMDKQAMDAALKAQGDAFEKRIKQVRDDERGVRAALNVVRDYVGEIPASMAFDSAADVYRHALAMKGVDGAKTMHGDALLPVLKTMPKIGSRSEPQKAEPLAMDTSSDAFKAAREIAPGLAFISAA